MTGDDQHDQSSIAVIGMAGRFPGARDLDGFWEVLERGADVITRFPQAPGDGRTPAYGVLDGADQFDAAFFGYSPREALMLDPQHRVFLECAWEALEHAGCVPAAYPGVIGVYGGSGDTDHFVTLRAHRDLFPGATDWELRLASGMDFLTSRVAYKLRLTGPAVTVQTACSTSLVAVHQACQGLIAGECDVALAGGVTVRVPHPTSDQGDDGILSRDGRCRPLDAEASGTVAGDGAGVVALKRLADALTDGDHVHAVILGSAVNNDGAGKVGFTAPSVDGQAAAVRAARLVAGVDPATIGYVEAHGTATEVGDPIEVRALAKAFGTARGSCVLGSVKSNIGHTDAAAGVIGLIKVVLSLRHGLIPGTAHFRRLNPRIDLAGTPFTVSGDAVPWPRTGAPRRAAVNSLGIGGTNAHMIVEETPAAPEPELPGDDRYHLLPLSARTDGALNRAMVRLAAHLRRADDVPPGCVAWTLQTGRTSFPHRAFVVCAGGEDAARALTEAGASPSVTAHPDGGRGVAFLFPGQGGQHVGMGGELYEREPEFRAAIDACAELAGPELGLDLRDMLYPRLPRDRAGAEARLATMRVCQPALFAVQHALAELWRSRGVTPSAVLGHSLGAYAAARTAGVLTLPEAMTLVLARGRLLDGLPPGAMLAVALPAPEVEPLLDGHLSIAAINGPEQCVVAGPPGDLDRLRRRLASHRSSQRSSQREVETRTLRIAAAAHSVLVEPVLAEYTRIVGELRPRPPRIPWISDRTGRPVSPGEAADPAFWAAHLRDTVRFSDALRTLLAGGDDVLLELGPGHTLGGLARRHPSCGPERPIVQSLPHAVDAAGGAYELLRATGRLWQAGVTIEWAALHRGRARRRIPLPTYPFERRRFRLGEEEAFTQAAADTGVAFSAPETELEKALAAAFGDALGLATVGVHDNFFDLGGDSLIAARVMSMVRPRLGAGLTARMIFRAPTVATLARLIDAGRRP
ncbi:type I polyketide synthase [Nonomuraea lactucae]|uniref:type I polyketide synthase n=1 Tax=Nonomuraea lactucae TaxID=2249762 RepID=UPI000DE2E160|nr:type I polyketide synthase [Nonomuraea lactucae]